MSAMKARFDPARPPLRVGDASREQIRNILSGLDLEPREINVAIAKVDSAFADYFARSSTVPNPLSLEQRQKNVAKLKAAHAAIVEVLATDEAARAEVRHRIGLEGTDATEQLRNKLADRVEMLFMSGLASATRAYDEVLKSFKPGRKHVDLALDQLAYQLVMIWVAHSGEPFSISNKGARGRQSAPKMFAGCVLREAKPGLTEETLLYVLHKARKKARRSGN